MSFSVDLWNGFDIIKNEFSINQKRIKQILDILTSYSLVQKEYYKSLDNLYKETKEIKESKDLQNSDSLLDDSIYILICSFKSECDKIKNHYNYMCKLITEIREKAEKIKLQISPYFTENIQNKDTFNKVLNNLILKQESYNKSCKELFYYLAENGANHFIEEKKNNKDKNKEKELNNSNNKDDKKKEKNSYKDIINKNFAFYLNNTILNTPNKKENLTKKILENKKIYIKCIDESDKEREKYNKLTEDLLNNLQINFKKLIYLFQSTIHNYVKDKNTYLNDIIEINKSNDNKIYSKIQYKKETLKFITKNATKEFPMNKLDFIPYKVNKNRINQKLSKFTELKIEDQNQIIDEIGRDFNSKINLYENQYLRQSFINWNNSDKIKKINKYRRSGSSDMLNFKNIGSTNIITNLNNTNTDYNNTSSNAETNKNANNSINNLKVNKNKDDIMINKENERKSNFLFIKDFVLKLILPKEEKENSILHELYSEESSDENENEKEKNDNNDKDSYLYNELLFSFMDLIALTNKDHNEYIDYFIKILGFHRSKGYFLLNENTYKIFVNIFNYILVNYKTSNNVIKNVILFSQTFYRVDNNPNNKIYVLNGLKNHTAFNNAETWHRAINYNLSLSIKNNNNYCLNIPNKEEHLASLNKVVQNTIISYLYDLKLSTSEKSVYEEVKNFYITIYHLDAKFIETQVNNLFGEAIDSNDNDDNKIEKIEDKNEDSLLDSNKKKNDNKQDKKESGNEDDIEK